MILTAIRRTSNAWICSSCRSLEYSAKRTIVSSSSSRKKLPETPARTRFAPSPTGYLHLGSLRTALYNYLLAKATGGQFLLRIEDTDQSRTVPDAQERICEDLQWAGLQWDEGPIVGGPYGPYIQSGRTKIYAQHTNQLLDSGHAYRCFCTAERLQELAQTRSMLGLPTDYDRTCAGIARAESDDRAHNGEKYTIRLKAPATYPAFEDLVYGRIGKPRQALRNISRAQPVFDDPVLLKSDGRPTYHLANVVDDHLMQITHVVRAVEWLPSTPKHVHLYNAFGWTPPHFVHVGLLQGAYGQKLSKRSGDIDIGHYRRNGVFPEALVNFVALLGWHHRQKTDIMDLKQMANLFDLNLTKGNTVVNFPKLDYLLKKYASTYAQSGGVEFQQMLDACVNSLREHGITKAPQGQDFEEYVALILKADPTSYLDLKQFTDRHRSFFEWNLKDLLVDEKIKLDDMDLVVEAIHELDEVEEDRWSAQAIDTALKEAVSTRLADTLVDTASEAETRAALLRLLIDLRRVVLASRKGPGVSASFEILGKTETFARLRKAGLCS